MDLERIPVSKTTGGMAMCILGSTWTSLLLVTGVCVRMRPCSMHMFHLTLPDGFRFG